MKKFALVSLIVLAALALAACGGGAQKVQVATDATWPPFEIVDEATKQIVGFDIDLLNAVAEKGGFEVEFVNVGFDPLLAGIAQCQYDLAISAITMPFAAGARSEQLDARLCLGTNLAQEMMEEILSKPFADPQGASNPGPEPGETPRRRFDNMDDYHGYAETDGHIADSSGAFITTPPSVGLSRSVSAQYVYVEGQDTSESPTFLQVRVTIRHNNVPLVELTRLAYKMPS